MLLSDEEKAKLEVIPRKYNIPMDYIYEDTVTVKDKPTLFNLFGLLAKNRVVANDYDEIPEKFDLRVKIQISSKDQRDYGLCWAFSSIRALETNENGIIVRNVLEWLMDK